jgi:uncharacterized protein (TIGR03067 family)
MYPSMLTALALAVGAPGAKDPPKKEASIVGEWGVESAVVGGKRDDPPAGTTWAFTADGKSVLSVAGGKGAGPGPSTYTADAKKDPAQVDITAGPKGTPMKGIYKRDGDTLILCLSLDGDSRPAVFESKEGAKVILLTLTKAKKKE